VISKRTKYGLKALAYLADQDRDRPVLIAEIAEAEKISHKFLESILLELKRNGLLGAKRGKGGGYYMLKSPEEISVATVYRLLEGPIAWLPCVSLNFYEKCTDCESEAKCRLHSTMLEVRDSILEVVENKTIADL